MTAVSRTTRRTLSEIGATCLKAARGAGCPWGLAEEAAMAARLLSAHDLPGAEILAGTLAAPRACGCDGRADAPACGIAQAAQVSDRLGDIADGRPMTLPPTVGAPLIAGALILGARRQGTALRLRWNGGAITCAPDGLLTEGATPSARPVTGLVAERCDRPPRVTAPAPSGRTIDMAAWNALDTLAARTLVPETAQSRAAGAGPGDADTD